MNPVTITNAVADHEDQLDRLERRFRDMVWTWTYQRRQLTRSEFLRLEKQLLDVCQQLETLLTPATMPARTAPATVPTTGASPTPAHETGHTAGKE